MDITSYVSGITQNITNQTQAKSIPATTVGGGFTDLASLTKTNVDAANALITGNTQSIAILQSGFTSLQSGLSAYALNGGSSKSIADIFGTTGGTTEQLNITPISAMTGAGGTLNKIFNNFDTSTVRTVTGLKIKSFSAQTISFYKLATDGVTATLCESQSIPSGISIVTLVTPVTLQVGEKFGINPSAQIYFQASGDTGSRIYTNSTSLWGASVITWAYTLILQTSGTLVYDTINKLNNAVVLFSDPVSGFTSNVALSAETISRTNADNTLSTVINNNYNLLLGANTGTTEVTVAPATPFSAMTSGGGSLNKVFNNFDTTTVRNISKINVKAVAAQTIEVWKLASDGTTLTDLGGYTIPTGLSQIVLSAITTLQVGEKIGLQPAISTGLYLVSTGDTGSRIYTNSTSAWTNTNITWAYSVVVQLPPDNVPYNTIKKLSDGLTAITGYTSQYAAAPSGGLELFQVSVNSNFPNYANTGTTVSDSESTHLDNAVIALPSGYTANGLPTRLVIYCHGAGSAVSSLSSNNINVTRGIYLMQKGYAILDVNGYPADLWETGEDPSKCSAMGGQMAIQCWAKAYRYVIAKYNIAKDGVLLLGTSMGGLTSTNLMNHTGIPVLAHCLEAPITDIYNQAWLHPWFTYPTDTKGTRYQLAKFYNFSGYTTFDFNNTAGLSTSAFNAALEAYWQANKQCVVGYDPANYQAFYSGSTKLKMHKAPLLIIHSANDTTSLPINSQNFVNSIQAAGGNAQLRLINDGNVYSNQHAPMSFTDLITDPEGVSVLASVREMYLFFKRFDK